MIVVDRIIIGTDHAGFALKEHLVRYIVEKYAVVPEDMGASTLVTTDDYPDFIFPVAERVASADDRACGIVLGGSGQGEAIVANRISGVRATVYYGGPEEIVTLGRTHNDANVLSLGARFLTQGQAERACDLFLGTLFPKEPRHAQRISKIDR